MFGFNLLFTRILPFVMLLCFVCFGITIVFNIQNLTYLSTETLNGHTYYMFDFNSYINNLDIDLLQRSTNNTIDTKAFTTIINKWEELWADGYDVGDVTLSIINGFTFLADCVLVIINIILLIPKIISGIILTALSFVGINIDNQDSIILNSLNTFLDVATIPMMQTWL